MFEQLRMLIADKFQLDAGTLAPDSTLADLELDSLDLVELSLIIEQELGAKISDTELADLERLGEVVQLVESRSAPTSGPA